MNDDELTELIRRALRHDDADVPTGLQPPPEFWDRIDAMREQRIPSTPPTPPARRRYAHVAAALAGIVAAAAIGTAIVLSVNTGPAAPLAHPTDPTSTSSPGAVTATFALYRPADYQPRDRCVPGPTVTPTSSPAPGGSSLVSSLDPERLGNPEYVRRPFSTDSFDSLTDVGGCIQAWYQRRGTTIPDGSTTLIVENRTFHTGVNDDGLTEVYLQQGQTIYGAASGNVTASDLATALIAAITMPNPKDSPAPTLHGDRA